MSAKQYRLQECGELPEFQELKRSKTAKVYEVEGYGFIQPGEKPVRKHEEDDLTEEVAKYCEVLLLQKKITAFSHVPQETFTKSWGIKAKNKRMGVKPGVPDMLIVYPHNVLFLELKKEKGGVVSESQKHWIEALSATGVVTAVVAKGWLEAKQAIDSLLE